MLVKEEPMTWEDTDDPSDSLTIDQELDIKPVSVKNIIFCKNSEFKQILIFNQ